MRCPIIPSRRARRQAAAVVAALAVAACRGDAGDPSLHPPPLPTRVAVIPQTAATASAPRVTATPSPPEPTATPVAATLPAATAVTHLATATPPAATADVGPAGDPGSGGAPSLAPTAPPPASGGHLIGGVTHVYQKWNNCGPSSVLMALSAFGVQLDQMAVAAAIKPDREDTNVTPDELAAFARSQGFEARVRYNGSRDVVRGLVFADVPVVVEQWIDVHGRGEMGHYRVVVGYDDAAAEFVAHDSYYGASRRFGYDAFDRMWRPFVGAYVAVYRPDQADLVRAVVGTDWDDAAMWRRALEDATRRADEAPGDAWAWFALGEVQARVGDHAGAVASFERANAIGLPFRAYWYQFGFYRALVEIGAFERALAHADATIASMNGENLEESHYWRGLALRRLGREPEARASFERALEFNPLFGSAREALAGG